LHKYGKEISKLAFLETRRSSPRNLSGFADLRVNEKKIIVMMDCLIIISAAISRSVEINGLLKPREESQTRLVRRSASSAEDP